MTDCVAFEAAMAESPDLARLPRGAREHAAGCAHCARILTDFAAIVRQARDLATPEPPPQVWEEIRRQLEKEGIIHNGGPSRRSKREAKTAALPRLVHSTHRSGS